MTDNTQNQNPEQAPAQGQAQAQRPHFEMLRVYSKNASLETPNSPAVFRTAWMPRLSVNFNVVPTLITSEEKNGVKTELYEVALRVEVQCENMHKKEDVANREAKGDIAFICEVNQAGMFALSGFDPLQTEYVLNAAAPNMLFPYAREYVANLINRGTFPPVNLAPINFDLLFRARKMQELQKAKQAQAAQEAANKDEPVA